MPKTEKRLKLTEIRAIEPKADVYELNKYCKYIIMIKKSNIITQQNIELMQKGREIMRIFAAFEIPCAIFVGSLDDVQIVELSVEKV